MEFNQWGHVKIFIKKLSLVKNIAVSREYLFLKLYYFSVKSLTNKFMNQSHDKN
jgi:hypothetical protein